MVRNSSKTKSLMCTVGHMTDRPGFAENFSLRNRSIINSQTGTCLESLKATASRRNEYGKNERSAITIAVVEVIGKPAGSAVDL